MRERTSELAPPLALLALCQVLVANPALQRHSTLVDLVKRHVTKPHTADLVRKAARDEPRVVAVAVLALALAGEFPTQSDELAAEAVSCALDNPRSEILAATLAVCKRAEVQGQVHEQQLAAELVRTCKPAELLTAVETLGMAADMPALLQIDAVAAVENFLFSAPVLDDVLLAAKKKTRTPSLSFSDASVAGVPGSPAGASLKPIAAAKSAPLLGLAPEIVGPSRGVGLLTKLILLRRLRFEEASDRFVSKLFSLLWFSLAPAERSSSPHSTVTVGQLQRLKCIAVGAIGNCYLLLDAQDILLVTPDDQRVEEAKPVLVRPLRGVRDCKIEHETTLVIATAEDIEPVRLNFEDARRSHIALMHIESRRSEILDELGRSMRKEIELEYNL